MRVNSELSLLLCLFKQKTADEVRISDWSSDVCSADLKPARGASTIIVEGGRIVSIADGYQPAEPGATLIDLKDQYVLPGLIDSHVHLTSDAGGIAGQLEEITLSPAAQAFNAEANGMKTLRAGFTTVRNLGDGDGAQLRGPRDRPALRRLRGGSPQPLRADRLRA